MLPIIDQYCKRKKINQIIFEKTPSNIFFKNNYYKNLFSKYDIFTLEDKLPFFLKKKILRYLYVLPKAIIFIFNFNQKKILKTNSWTKMQFLHAVWDTAVNLTKSSDSFIDISFKNKLLSSVKNYETQMVAKLLIKNNLSAVFLNHSVYFYRTLLSEFRRRKNIQVFIQANFTIYRQSIKHDNNESILDNKILSFLKKNISLNTINKYWQNRLNGKSTYQLANDASKTKIKINKDKIPKNILMLHIFKDSPFGLIDKKRIFSDYVDWLNFTLKIISKSNETWGIKFHPSASRWGENSHKIFNEFINKNFNSIIPKNFILINNEFSNYEIFKNTNRLVTFWGTCHIEAASFGLKPIIIRDVQLNKYKSTLAFKPKNLKEYRIQLLTKKIGLFRLNKQQISDSLFLLYVRENVLNFINDINQHWVLRGDKNEYINKNLNKTIKNILSYDSFLRQNGELLSKNFTHTLAKKYIKYFS